MENVYILFNQLVIMFLFLAIGWLLWRIGLISSKNSSALTSLLLYAILPCVILRSRVQADHTQAAALLQSFGLGGLTLLVSMGISYLLFRKKPAANFGAAFSNAGFMGIPLVSALLGSDAVFYTIGMIAMLNILQWTYGQSLLVGSWKECKPSALLRNPLILAFALGLVLYAFSVSLPKPVCSVIDALADCNAPVAMIILGVLLGNVSIGDLFRSRTAWAVSVVRLLVIPILTLLVLNLFSGVPQQMKMAILIAASAPVGTNLAVYVQANGGDVKEPTSMICLSTLLSAITMPIILFISSYLF